MPRILIVFSIVVLTAGLCYAETPVPSTQAAAKAVPSSMMAQGRIDAVTPAAGGGRLTVILADGTKLVVNVKSTTTIYDASVRAITLDKLTKDQKVAVKYTAAGGLNEAASVNVLK